MYPLEKKVSLTFFHDFHLNLLSYRAIGVDIGTKDRFTLFTCHKGAYLHIKPPRSDFQWF